MGIRFELHLGRHFAYKEITRLYRKIVSIAPEHFISLKQYDFRIANDKFCHIFHILPYLVSFRRACPESVFSSVRIEKVHPQDCAEVECAYPARYSWESMGRQQVWEIPALVFWKRPQVSISKAGLKRHCVHLATNATGMLHGMWTATESMFQNERITLCIDAHPKQREHGHYYWGHSSTS